MSSCICCLFCRNGSRTRSNRLCARNRLTYAYSLILAHLGTDICLSGYVALIVPFFFYWPQSVVLVLPIRTIYTKFTPCSSAGEWLKISLELSLAIYFTPCDWYAIRLRFTYWLIEKYSIQRELCWYTPTSNCCENYNATCVTRLVRLACESDAEFFYLILRLIEVQCFGMQLGAYVLYAAAGILDRYLSIVPVAISNLQLVGICAIAIASKMCSGIIHWVGDGVEADWSLRSRSYF